MKKSQTEEEKDNRARIEEKEMGKERGSYIVLLVNDTKAKDAKLNQNEWGIIPKSS